MVKSGTKLEIANYIFDNMIKDWNRKVQLHTDDEGSETSVNEDISQDDEEDSLSSDDYPSDTNNDSDR